MRALFLDGGRAGERFEIADIPPRHLRTPLHGLYMLVAVGPVGAVYARQPALPGVVDRAEDYAHDPDLWE